MENYKNVSVEEIYNLILNSSALSDAINRHISLIAISQETFKLDNSDTLNCVNFLTYALGKDSKGSETYLTIKLVLSDYECKAYLFDGLNQVSESVNLSAPYLKFMFNKFSDDEEYIGGFAEHQSMQRKRIEASFKSLESELQMRYNRSLDGIDAHASYDDLKEDAYASAKAYYKDMFEKGKQNATLRKNQRLAALDSLEISLFGKTLDEIARDAERLEPSTSGQDASQPQ